MPGVWTQQFSEVETCEYSSLTDILKMHMLLYVYCNVEISRYANSLILRLRIAVSSNVQNIWGHYFYTATIACEF